MIQGTCPGCARAYSVGDHLAGKTVNCPACKTRFELTRLELPAAATPAEEADGAYELAGEPEPPPRPAPAGPADLLNEPTPDPTNQQPPSKPKKKRKKDTAAGRRVTAASTTGERWYLLLGLALLPLAWSLLASHDSVIERLEAAVEAHPEALDAVLAKQPQSPEALFDVLTSHLPEQRLPGAHLSRQTIWHWVYAVLGAVVMFGLLLAAFPRGAAKPATLAMLAAAIATLGVGLLLVVQAVAEFSTHLPTRIGFGLWSAAVGTLQLIAFSYRAAFDPTAGFMLSFIGFTLGVGLCEELIKLIPVLIYFRHESELDWRGAAAWGAAGGLGFGVAEGVFYSAGFYNGIATFDAYLVRFVSCVALHTIWSAGAGILAWQHQDLMEGEHDWHDRGQILLYVVGPPALLHGLYDTLLKRDYLAAALLTAVVSLAGLAVLIELNRQAEAAE